MTGVSAGSVSGGGSPVTGSGIWDLERGLVRADSGRRQQADPLPRKRGEIGYDEAAEERETVEASGSSSAAEESGPPARHPADRDAPPSFSSSPASSVSPSNEASNTGSPETTTASDTSSAHSTGKRSLISFLKPERLPRVGGINFTTFLRFLAHILLLVGTVVGWVMVVSHIPPPRDNQVGLNTTQVFIHVTFVIAILMQLVFLERIVYRVRAERYAHKHPGQILPSSRSRSAGYGSSGPSMGLAPWNRPPLPTYAAALSANGLGTGDVEDNAIAIPPPPAYGNTRGSTLLLAGLMPENLRAQRTRERVRSGNGETVRGSLMSRVSRLTTRTTRSSRPVSYRSHDSAWEERLDADRALVLEETLAKLEEGK
ncbi:hypothetical protein BXZ70DRAFT_959461 [Cristinia sonorae]|uniref:Uncharacterized protein n=1 Tax=Cristinia sonorae TaxID=1940300 RepID=A0A8K0UFQ3_9AGAR|nr:hypothetical protein BXZ70DRAFT_959461 [Cristinia sonorae]